MKNFSGKWQSTFGLMHLEQSGNTVSGYYQMGVSRCTIKGEVRNGRLVFQYQEPGTGGEGWFELRDDDLFEGQWRENGTQAWLPWKGERLTDRSKEVMNTFAGLWKTSFGPMRLIQEGDRVHGHYEFGGQATVKGQVKNNRFSFRYQEQHAQGEGSWQLGEGGQSFHGDWLQEGKTERRPWEGVRIHAQPGVSWLVILEAHWQAQLFDSEFAFGNMLREFFARVPTVQVRQRFFTNADGLAQWCRELTYLPEPTILVLATHGDKDGLTLNGKTLDASWAEPLKYAENLQLVHFSACNIMKNAEQSAWYKAFGGKSPVSGYTIPVDWSGSALIEFLYLDMIFSKGLSPAAAAEQTVKMLGFAGTNTPMGSPYPAANFRFLPAQKK